VRRFQLHLAEAGLSICNRNQIMTGLRFLFRVTLRRLDLAAYPPRFRALALFGRRPLQPADGPVMPASENLHASRRAAHGALTSTRRESLATLARPWRVRSLEAMSDRDRVEIFDGHNDAIQCLAEYRDGGRDFLARSNDGHLDLPRAREGALIGGLFALFAKSERAPEGDLTQTADGYEVRLADALDPEYASRQIDLQLAALARLVGRSAGQIRFVTSVSEIEAARRENAFSIVVHMEGAEAIGPKLEGLNRLHAAGLRSLGLVWSRPNIFGHGVPFAHPRSPDTGPGLTPTGKELVRACNHLGIMIDTSHLNERGFWDVAALSTAPLVATHSCAYTICRSTRNLTDRQLDAIRESDGVVGFNLSVNDVRPDANLDENTSLDMIVRHIDYMVQRLGEDRVALGSDFDGAVMPRPIKDASGLPPLFEELRRHGFDDAMVRKIALENWLRVFKLTWH
jgi:membrane dipeptidase